MRRPFLFLTKQRCKCEWKNMVVERLLSWNRTTPQTFSFQRVQPHDVICSSFFSIIMLHERGEFSMSFIAIQRPVYEWLNWWGSDAKILLHPALCENLRHQGLTVSHTPRTFTDWLVDQMDFVKTMSINIFLFNAANLPCRVNWILKITFRTTINYQKQPLWSFLFQAYPLYICNNGFLQCERMLQQNTNVFARNTNISDQPDPWLDQCVRTAYYAILLGGAFTCTGMISSCNPSPAMVSLMNDSLLQEWLHSKARKLFLLRIEDSLNWRCQNGAIS